MRITRHGTQSTVQGMSIILGRRHRLLHVRALRAKRNRGEQENCSIHNGSPPNYYIKKGRPHGHRYGKKPGDRENYIAKSLKKKCKKKDFLGVHDRFIRDEKFRKNMFDNGRTEKICRQMDDLADEDHTHHLTQEEIEDSRANWWIRSNTIGSDTMPIRHRSDFKQALSTLRQLKDKEDAAHHNQRWMQSYSSSWWNWQESWWHSSYENHHEDVPSTD